MPRSIMRLTASGTASVAANDLFLHGYPGPAGQPALFFFGPSRVSLPFGNGFRCVRD